MYTILIRRMIVDFLNIGIIENIAIAILIIPAIAFSEKDEILYHVSYILGIILQSSCEMFTIFGRHFFFVIVMNILTPLIFIFLHIVPILLALYLPFLSVFNLICNLFYCRDYLDYVLLSDSIIILQIILMFVIRRKFMTVWEGRFLHLGPITFMILYILIGAQKILIIDRQVTKLEMKMYMLCAFIIALSYIVGFVINLRISRSVYILCTVMMLTFYIIMFIIKKNKRLELEVVQPGRITPIFLSLVLTLFVFAEFSALGDLISEKFNEV